MQNIKYYGLAFAIILIAELVITGLQLAGGYFPAGHPAAILVGNLSGLTLGGIIVVIGFLKDNRLEQERKRTEQERERTEQERERADAAEAMLQQERERTKQERERTKQERERAEQERERADQLLSELIETQKENRDAMEARIRRLEEQGDSNPTRPSDEK